METYIYKAHVDSVYDGDTITCTIDCGFGVYLAKQKIRLYGINCPEMRGDEKEEGRRSRDAVREKILDKQVLIKTMKDKKGKYGRYLGIVYIGDENVNEWIIAENYGVRADY